MTTADALDFWSFAAGAANVVMQLSWPQVGHGVVESRVTSGSLMHHPWKRARTTFSYLAVAIVGNADDRAAYRAAVDGAHLQVVSTPASPVKYNAFDRDLQMWVAGLPFVGLEDAYQLLYGPLTPANAEPSTVRRSRWVPRCRSPTTNGRPPVRRSTTTGLPRASGSRWTTPSAAT